MRKRLNLFFFIFIISFTFISCSNDEINMKKYKVTIVDNSNNDISYLNENIKEEFNILISKSPSEREVLDFIDEYIKNSDKEINDYFVFGFEKIQKTNINRRVNSFFRGNIQEMFSNEYFSNKTHILIKNRSDVSSVVNDSLKEFILEYLSTGYLIVGKNGVFYPEINYEFYSRYFDYITTKSKLYFELMQLEYGEMSTIDGKLNITWNEVFKRILLAEKYIVDYKDGEKYEDVYELYRKYIEIYLFGTVKTKVFTTNGSVKKYVKESYKDVYLDNLDSPIVQKLRDYFKLLEENNYKINESVNNYRNNIISGLK